MREYLKFYIDGSWVDPLQPNSFDVENPATEQVSGQISLGSAADVDVAVNAARRVHTIGKPPAEPIIVEKSRLSANQISSTGDISKAAALAVRALPGDAKTAIPA